MTGQAYRAFAVGLYPEFASLVTTLDETIHHAAELDCAIKWHQLTYAKGGDYHHWICAINVSKKQVSLRFHFGSLLSDPEHVLRAGTSNFMRSIDFVQGVEVDRELVARYVQEAVRSLEYFKKKWIQLQEQYKGDEATL